MNKPEQIRAHSLKAWAEARGLPSEWIACDEKTGDIYFCEGNNIIIQFLGDDMVLDLDFWREVPIKNWDEYQKELRSILHLQAVDGGYNFGEFDDPRIAIHNASIPQRMEALYNAEAGG